MKITAQKKGFTIMETLVAIAILTVGLTVPMTIVYQTSKSGEIAQETVQAFYFAQEGVEFVRYVRDTNVLRDTDPDPSIDTPPWLDKLDKCIGPGKICYIYDILERVQTAGPHIVQDWGSNPPIKYDTNTDLYVTVNSGAANYEETIYTRQINILETVADREAEVTVTVTWTPRTGPDKTVTLKENLFNWTGF